MTPGLPWPWRTRGGDVVAANGELVSRTGGTEADARRLIDDVVPSLSPWFERLRFGDDAVVTFAATNGRGHSALEVAAAINAQLGGQGYCAAIVDNSLMVRRPGRFALTGPGSTIRIENSGDAGSNARALRDVLRGDGVVA